MARQILEKIPLRQDFKLWLFVGSSFEPVKYPDSFEGIVISAFFLKLGHKYPNDLVNKTYF